MSTRGEEEDGERRLSWTYIFCNMLLEWPARRPPRKAQFRHGGNFKFCASDAVAVSHRIVRTFAHQEYGARRFPPSWRNLGPGALGTSCMSPWSLSLYHSFRIYNSLYSPSVLSLTQNQQTLLAIFPRINRSRKSSREITKRTTMKKKSLLQTKISFNFCFVSRVTFALLLCVCVYAALSSQYFIFLQLSCKFENPERRKHLGAFASPGIPVSWSTTAQSAL